MQNIIFVSKTIDYNAEVILNFLRDELFDCVSSTSVVVIKPNWVRESHQYRPDDWEYIITHPAVITAVILKLLEKLKEGGKIVILDSPETASSFEKIISHYPVEYWQKITKEKGVELSIIDLRDDEWIEEDGVIVSRRKLSGDPKGKTEVNLAGYSEFRNHHKSKSGYYGADYNIVETNTAHNSTNNLYRVSRTVLEADVFINLPKLKTHKKAGITCCLKNLVGINTYKNFLPHYSLGNPFEFGDQFPHQSLKNTFEESTVATIKQKILINPKIAKYFKPFIRLGKTLFGNTNRVIRSGNWYGNDTLWRMVLDLNKILFYAKPDGTLRGNNIQNKKHYIGIVDAILCGEGNGPKASDPKKLGYIITGLNPVAIDSACSILMGFDPFKIPSIKNAFELKDYKITNFQYNELKIIMDKNEFALSEIPIEFIVKFKPHFGWIGKIEDTKKISN